MKTNKEQLERVATILRNWKASDAGREASSSEVAAEIDQAYAEYLDLLPRRMSMASEGQKEWERMVA